MIPFWTGLLVIALFVWLQFSSYGRSSASGIRIVFALWAVAVVILTDWSPITAWIGIPALTGRNGGQTPPSLLVQIIAILSLIAATALGVAAQVWFEWRILKETGKPAWDDTAILALIVAIIVLLPVFGTLNEQILKADLLWPRVTALFLAFENGFLWKGYMKRRLEQRQNEKSG